MIKIQIPDEASSEIKVALDGRDYTFQYSYSSVSECFYLSIFFEGEEIISSLKLIEGVPLLRKYALDNFEHGELVLGKLRSTEASPGRNNVGINKAYELIYISNEELSEV